MFRGFIVPKHIKYYVSVGFFFQLLYFFFLQFDIYIEFMYN